VIRDIRDETRDVPDGATVVVVDGRRTRINLSTAFGAMMNDAVPSGSCVYRRLRKVEGRVVAIR
jgi:hypothetical protein